MQHKEPTVSELKQGYCQREGTLVCLACGQTFEEGAVYPVEGKLLQASRAIQQHLQSEHGGARRLIFDEGRYNSLTENQKRLLELLSEGKSDKEVALETGVSPATVRRQRFSFREKAKQARLYLAQYESVFAKTAGLGGEIIPIHDNAHYVDERYVVTQEEKEKILASVFHSLSPLRLKNFPKKDKKKVVILAELAALFVKGQEYAEKEVNALLGEVYPDYATLRRYLVDYGFLKRTRGGEKYWLA